MIFTARSMVATRCYRLGFQEGFQIGRRIWLLGEVSRIETLLERNGIPLTAEQLRLMYKAVDALYPPVPQYRGFKAELRFFMWGLGIDLLSRKHGDKNDDGFRWPKELPRTGTALWVIRAIAGPAQLPIIARNPGL